MGPRTLGLSSRPEAPNRGMATAVARLTVYLKAARDELCILDRFFGQHLEEWRLLDPVSVPIRVLTGKLEKDPSGGVAVPTFGQNITVRYRPKAPIHERIYFWNGGGIVLGGSPSTFGKSPLRITRLREAEVAEWRQIFEAEWQSPLYTRSLARRWPEALAGATLRPAGTLNATVERDGPSAPPARLMLDVVSGMRPRRPVPM